MKELLMKDLKQAMKDKDVTLKNTIQLLRAVILNKEKELQRDLTETEIQELVASEVKKRNDTLKIYAERQITDQIENITREINILKNYLPKLIEYDDLVIIIEDVIKVQQATSIKEMGNVIKLVKEQVGVKAEGKTISEIVKQKLSEVEK